MFNFIAVWNSLRLGSHKTNKQTNPKKTKSAWKQIIAILNEETSPWKEKCIVSTCFWGIIKQGLAGIACEHSDECLEVWLVQYYICLFWALYMGQSLVCAFSYCVPRGMLNVVDNHSQICQWGNTLILFQKCRHLHSFQAFGSCHIDDVGKAGLIVFYFPGC